MTAFGPIARSIHVECIAGKRMPMSQNTKEHTFVTAFVSEASPICVNYSASKRVLMSEKSNGHTFVTAFVSEASSIRVKSRHISSRMTKEDQFLTAYTIHTHEQTLCFGGGKRRERGS